MAVPQDLAETDLQKPLTVFADNTSFLGIPVIRRSKSKVWRVVFLLSMLLACAYGISQIMSLTQRYLKNESTTRLRTRRANPEFPTITICNINQVRKSQADKTGDDDFTGMIYYYSGGRSRRKRSTGSQEEDKGSYGYSVLGGKKVQVSTGTFQGDLYSNLQETDQGKMESGKGRKRPKRNLPQSETTSVSTPNNVITPGATTTATKLSATTTSSTGATSPFQLQPTTTRSGNMVTTTPGFYNNLYTRLTAHAPNSSNISSTFPGPVKSIQTTTKPQYKKGSKCGSAYKPTTSFSTKSIIDIDFQKQLAKLSQEARDRIGHHRGHTLLDCVYDEHMCSEMYLEDVWTPQYGKCFSFNAYNNNSKNTLSVTKTGSKHGLDLLLFIEKDEYLELLTDGFGIKVDIHPKGTRAFPKERGLSFAPGQSIYVSLALSETTWAGEPYTPCVKVKPKEYPKYNAEECSNLCLDNLLRENCKCMRIEYAENYPKGLNLTDCDHGQYIDCLATQMTDSYCLGCNCKPACREQRYTPTVSSYAWPSLRYWGAVLAFLQSRNMSSYNTAMDMLKSGDTKEEQDQKKMTFLQSNCISLKVFFSSLVRDTVEEVPTYELNQFLSDIGGNLGLWMGASVITVCELVDVIVHLVLTFTTRRQRKRQVALKEEAGWAPDSETKAEEKDLA